MTERGILTVVSGFSGSGKGTIMKELLTRYGSYCLSVSATTREPRDGEIDGVHYFFVTRERMLEMISRNELYEYAEYQGNYYGTPKQYVDQKLSEGKDVILEIEVQGAEKIKKQFPDTVLIFVTPPSVEELRNRLTGRGSEDAKKIEGRLLRAVEESACMDKYDYILVNDDLTECVEHLHSIMIAEHAKSVRKKSLKDEIVKELKEFRKERKDTI